LIVSIFVTSSLVDAAERGLLLRCDASFVCGSFSSIRASRTWAIVDEAYQMRSDMLLLIADRFDRVVFVGDPGQLDPFSVIETSRWLGLP
jgi:hypothetical protein